MNAYYYIDNITKQQCGPVILSELQQKNIQPDTPVWCSGMGDWTEARNVQELEFLFNSNISQPTTQNTPPISTPQQQYSQQYNQNQPNRYPNNNNQNQYGQAGYGSRINEVRPIPKNWLIESVLVTCLCCLPFGIAGIVQATKVESLYYSGDYESSLQASKDAKKWTAIGFFIAIGGWALYILFFLGLGFFSSF